jgi:uncharacterized protein
MTEEKIVLDSYALLALLKNEKGADEVEARIRSAQKGRCDIFLNRINMGEVYYILVREKGKSFADRIEAGLMQLPVRMVEADWECIREAALLKARFPMSFADCFAAVTAVMNQAILMTGDPEFKHVEDQIRIQWIGK